MSLESLWRVPINRKPTPSSAAACTVVSRPSSAKPPGTIEAMCRHQILCHRQPQHERHRGRLVLVAQEPVQVRRHQPRQAPGPL